MNNTKTSQSEFMKEIHESFNDYLIEEYRQLKIKYILDNINHRKNEST